MEQQSIAKNLLYQRKLKGLTQEELSEKTQVTIRTIQRIEKGDVNPHLQTIKLLAVGLDINLDELMPLDDPKEENIQKKWLLLIHGTPFLGLVIPFCNILFPLFLWIHKADDNKIYDKHGRAVVNFHATMTLAFIISLVSFFILPGLNFLLFFAIMLFSVVVTLINIVRALNQQKYWYPLSIGFIKKKKKELIIKPPSKLMILLCVSLISFTNNMAQEIHRLDNSTISAELLTSKIEMLTKKAQVTGLAISIFNNNEAIYKEAFGYANIEKQELLTTDTVFYGASFSKAVFGYLVAKLASDGIIDLDKPLQEYLDIPIPEIPFKKEWRGFSDLKNDLRYKKITARMCLNHTTGFPNWRWLTPQGFDENGKLLIAFEPGSRYSYSGEGIQLLQYVVENLTGKGLESLAQEHIFSPFKMDMSSYVWQNRFKNMFCNGHTSNQQIIEKDTEDEAGAAGSMETTLDDYTKFIGVLLKQTKKDTPFSELLFKPGIRIRSKAQFGPLAKEDSHENDPIKLSYSLGWGILQSPHGFAAFKEGHSEGFQHYSIIFPQKEIAVIIMSNSDNAESIFKELLEITIGDIYTPWKWENYIPYNSK